MEMKLFGLWSDVERNDLLLEYADGSDVMQAPGCYVTQMH